MRAEAAYLNDIIDSALMIQGFIAGRSYDDFLRDQLLQEGVLRRLGVIGEAASRLAPHARDRIVGPPWRQIIAMRNVLVHVYFGVELKIAWDTASNDLQPLIDAVRKDLAGHGSGEAPQAPP